MFEWIRGITKMFERRVPEKFGVQLYLKAKAKRQKDCEEWMKALKKTLEQPAEDGEVIGTFSFSEVNLDPKVEGDVMLKRFLDCLWNHGFNYSKIGTFYEGDDRVQFWYRPDRGGV